MVCFNPIRGFQIINQKTEKGKQLIIFNENQINGRPYVCMDLACGQCIGCRIDKSREWAARCVNEASQFEYNCFITLTYDEENLPENGSLNVKDFQNFMKEIRRQYVGKTRNNGKNMPEKIERIRFFHCGEYGEACRECGLDIESCYCDKYEPGIGRPHHHAILFNFDFPDKVLEATKDNNPSYSSEILDRLWKKGIHSIQEVTFETAAYVARYCCKKVTGDRAKEYYKRCDWRTGKKHTVKPEYITMSRRPGIGADWYEKYKSDCYPKDFLTYEGRYVKIPKFYDKRYEIENPKEFEKVKRERRLRAEEFPQEHTIRRLITKHKIKHQQYSRYERKLK